MSSPRMGPAFIRFLMVGASSTAIQYAVLLAAVEWFAQPATPSSVVGFATSAMFNYWANKHFTFASPVRDVVAAPKFAAMVALGLLVTWLCMRELTGAGVQYMLSQVLTTGLVMVINFLVASRWVFGRREPPGSSA